MLLILVIVCIFAPVLGQAVVGRAWETFQPRALGSHVRVWVCSSEVLLT